MGYRRGLSKCSRLSVLRDHLSQNLKAALDRSKAVQSSIDPVLLTNTTNSTVSDAQTSLPVSDTPSPTPTAGTKSLIPNWSYEKSSTAAVIIFTTIAVTALLFLIFLSAQKVRPSWARRRAERLHSRSDGDVKNGCKPASGSTRENIMFSSGRPSTSSQTYIVEQRDGSDVQFDVLSPCAAEEGGCVDCETEEWGCEAGASEEDVDRSWSQTGSRYAVPDESCCFDAGVAGTA
ncbi:hypothetical protein ANOM_007406 [Aspergillus terreus]|uniref:Uncharacterized protein n=1 Tax=Aspergillus terreus TaxID=33178 RepID=A0A5M3YSH8_ASPTE|nr:hypothetical protein ATETN484_0003014000 [Aspergillus terreus]GFF14148.1 hypothetical protein ANOM_007406 [Aspergillus terreus]